MIPFRNRFYGVYVHPEKYTFSKKKICVPSGLSHDSSLESIIEDGEPIRWLVSKGYVKPCNSGFVDNNEDPIDLGKDISETALVYVHGLRSVPRNVPTSRKIVEFLMKKGMDLYAPLLLSHGKKTTLFQYNPYLTFEKLKKDIAFITNLNYKRIYFVAFSHGALQMVRASLEGLLDHRCSIILLCPQLMFNRERSAIKRSIILALNLFTRKFFKFEQETFKMMISSGLRNNFTYILCGKDAYVSPDLEPFLLEQNGFVKGAILASAGHFISEYPEFYEIIQDHLTTLMEI